MSGLHSEQLDQIAGALAAAQGQIRAAAKDSLNPHFGNRYADLASVWDACREPLSSNGLAVVQQPIDSEAGMALRTLLVHKSGQWIASNTRLVGNVGGMQQLGSSLTYARRYGLAAMIGVVADEDDDGNASAKPAARTPRAAAGARTAPMERKEAPVARGASAEPAAPAAPAEAPKDADYEGAVRRLWAVCNEVARANPQVAYLASKNAGDPASVKARLDRMAHFANYIGRTVTSSRELTVAELRAIADGLTADHKLAGGGR